MISRLAETYSTPRFGPHVTLLTRVPFDNNDNNDDDDEGTCSIETVRQTLSDWKRQEPEDGELELELTRLGSKSQEGVYFQYLFAEVKLSDRLERLRTRVRRGLIPRRADDDDTVDDYFPHLSLMYGTDEDDRDRDEDEDETERGATEEKKKKRRIAREIMSELESDGTVVTTTKKEDGDRAGDGRITVSGVDRFVAREVWCVRCQGPVEAWTVLGKIAL